MTETPYKNSQIQWQQTSEDPGISEKTILIEAFTDTLLISQEGERVSLNYESIDEFCRNLKGWAKLRKNGKLK